jgi:hypothetical protein
MADCPRFDIAAFNALLSAVGEGGGTLSLASGEYPRIRAKGLWRAARMPWGTAAPADMRAVLAAVLGESAMRLVESFSGQSAVHTVEMPDGSAMRFQVSVRAVRSEGRIAFNMVAIQLGKA